MDATKPMTMTTPTECRVCGGPLAVQEDKGVHCAWCGLRVGDAPSEGLSPDQPAATQEAAAVAKAWRVEFEAVRAERNALLSERDELQARVAELETELEAATALLGESAESESPGDVAADSPDGAAPGEPETPKGRRPKRSAPAGEAAP